MLYNFTFYSIGLNGKLSNRENLNADEIDNFMFSVYGKFANVIIIRSDGKVIKYTDNGTNWERI